MSTTTPVTRAKAQPSDKLGQLFVKAGIARGIETTVVLGPDADPLEVIEAIAADAFPHEKTPERAAVLAAIRTACAKTRALVITAQPTEQAAQ
jgi:predicted DNA-binding transcriptional regulator YafY